MASGAFFAFHTTRAWLGRATPSLPKRATSAFSSCLSLDSPAFLCTLRPGSEGANPRFVMPSRRRMGQSTLCKTDSRWLLWNWQWPGLSAVSFRKPAGDRLAAKVLAEWTAAEPALRLGRRPWWAVPLRSRHSARTWHSRQGSRQVRVSTDGLRLLGPRRPSAARRWR